MENNERLRKSFRPEIKKHRRTIVVNQLPKITVFVKCRNHHICILVRRSQTILALKQWVQRNTGVPVESQEYTFNGNILEDTSPFYAYGMKDNSIIHVAEVLPVPL